MKALLLLLVLLRGALVCAAPADEAWLFPDDGKPLHVLERADALGLSNGQTAFLLRRDDGALLGMWQKGGPNLIGKKQPTPLWTLEAAQAGTDKPLAIAASN